MPRYSTKAPTYVNVKKRYHDLPFAELGRTCATIYDDIAKKDLSTYGRISESRAAVAIEVDKFVDENIAKNSSYAVSLIEGIQSKIRTTKLTTVDGIDYSFARATADLKKIDSLKDSDYEQYLKARSSLGSLISPVAFYKSFVVANGDMGRGIHEFLVRDSRSGCFTKQYQKPANNFSILVPLYMQPFKMVGYFESDIDALVNPKPVHVPYSHWSTEYLYSIVQLSLFNAMTCDLPIPTTEEVLHAREIALVTKTGPKAGTALNPVSTFRFSAGEHALAEFPHMARLMLAQTWCAHPQNRTPSMVLDPREWDSYPKPLLTTEVIQETAAVENNNFAVKNERDIDLPF